MPELKLGIIGLSPGNGHPYSWSAIFNGYNPEVMKDCPFKAIPQYLSQRHFPNDAIAEARVTHIWTQDKNISRHVAAASLIENIVDDYVDMIGRVGAVLLARDDAENHYEMARPFLEAGLPIYIDKPLARSRAEAEKIYALRRYDNQIFSCSALAFSDELCLSETDREEIGPIRIIEGTVVRDWEKYAAHVIEPALKILGNGNAIRKTKITRRGDACEATVIWDSGMVTLFKTLGNQPGGIELNVVGDRGTKKLVFTDSFGAFKNALTEFVAVARKQKETIPAAHVLRVIDVLEAGCQGG